MFGIWWIKHYRLLDVYHWSYFYLACPHLDKRVPKVFHIPLDLPWPRSYPIFSYLIPFYRTESFYGYIHHMILNYIFLLSFHTQLSLVMCNIYVGTPKINLNIKIKQSIRATYFASSKLTTLIVVKSHKHSWLHSMGRKIVMDNNLVRMTFFFKCREKSQITYK